MLTGFVRYIIAVCDASTPKLFEKYRYAIQWLKKLAKTIGIEIFADIQLGRRGSTTARNIVLNKASQFMNDDDILVMIDDDYIIPAKSVLASVVLYFATDDKIGMIGGRLININKRKIDPDFYLNIIPGLADSLSNLTGFIFLDTKHGPRYANYLTPLMAIRGKVLKEGIRYDPNFSGSAYREETDLQEQVKHLGYRLLHNSKFYAYHLALEVGGNREQQAPHIRFYWKAKNHTYYLRKYKKSLLKIVMGAIMIALYSIIYGPKALLAVVMGLKDGLHL